MPKYRDIELRTWIEVSKGAVDDNYRAFRQLIGPETKLMSVVKSNAYGHGLIDFSRVVADLGVDWLGVDSIVEAISLRNEGFTLPILVLGYTPPANFSFAAKNNITLAVSSFDSLALVFKFNEPLSIHLKLDTGMHRQGFLPERWAELSGMLTKVPKNINIEGVFSHLAAADEERYRAQTQKQIKDFFGVASELEKVLNKKLLKHLGATKGTLGYPDCYGDMVRVGLGMYGLRPSPVNESPEGEKVKLTPVLTWKTIISEVKVSKDGGGVGYGFTGELKIGGRMAICPIGYWHGFPRALSNKGSVLVRGKRLPVLGRVSMDMIALDAESSPEIKVGDEVVIIGGGLPVEEMAKICGTSNYEIITRLNPLIHRIYK